MRPIEVDAYLHVRSDTIAGMEITSHKIEGVEVWTVLVHLDPMYSEAKPGRVDVVCPARGDAERIYIKILRAWEAAITE
jgi:hypothetical protein